MCSMIQKVQVFLICFLLLIGSGVKSNNHSLDSIKQIVESSTEEQNIEVILTSIEQIILRHPNQAIVFAQRALAEARKRNDKTSEIRAQFLIAKAQYLTGNYNLSLEQLDPVYFHYQTTKDSVRLVETLQLYGQIHTHIGDFRKALDYTQSAINLAEKANISKVVADLTREMGNIYFYFGERTIALDFFQKSLSISQKSRDKDGIAKAYNNMGRVYAELGRFSTALDYLTKSLAAKDKDEDKSSYGNTLINIGSVYLRTGEHQKSLQYFDEARGCFEAVNNTEGTANSLYYLGLAYFNINRHNQALALQNEAWKIASSINSKRLMVNISRATANIYESIGNYQQAYKYIQTYLSLRDSVYSDEKSKLLIELETRHQLQSKERQIELLSKERALEQSEKRRIGILIVLLSVVAIFFITLSYIAFNRFRYKSKLNNKLLQEISHRKRIEAQLNEYQEHLENLVEERTWELKVAKDKAEDADKLKTAFLTNMSHEIRTPMNAILGFSYLLTDKESTDEAKGEYIKIIKSNGEVLMNLINDILDISIIESGQLKTKNRPFLLTELLDELKYFFAQEMEKSGKKAITLTTDFDKLCGNLTVTSDKIRLRQILSNLLWNAIKFTNVGQITFGYRLSGTEELIFYVKDTGVGINPEHHKLIFERFSKISTSTESTAHTGTGLGLAISRELVAALGGTIWLDSIPGKGSTFYFTIPYQPNKGSIIEPSIANFKVNKAIFAGKTILIAEDVVSNFKLVEAFLSNLDMTILWAKDGVEALNIFRETPNINIILMDIQMPIMDGLNALKNIRKLNPTVPVIVNTAFYLNDEMEKSFEAGCNDYMSKPIRKEDLLIKLSQYIDK